MLASAAVLLACLAAGAHADPARDVLWAALKTCVLAKTATGRAFPCLSVDLGAADRPGTAVLRAPGAATHSVVMPTDTVPGLESPVLRGPRGAAYWRAALAARHVVSDSVPGLAPAAVGLAVNSAGGRSQDQLHIHLDCVRADVTGRLREFGRHPVTGWTRLPALPGGRYRALFVPEARVAGFNPFAALARLPGPPDWRRTSFAAVALPPDEGGGVVLLAYRAADAHAEELLDHTCGGRTG